MKILHREGDMALVKADKNNYDYGKIIVDKDGKETMQSGASHFSKIEHAVNHICREMADEKCAEGSLKDWLEKFRSAIGYFDTLMR